MEKNSNKTRVIFYGGAQSVTGSNFLMEDAGGKARFLIDCGLFQGTREREKKNREPFAYDPKSIDALFVTHAHIDHIGRIPKLVADGFSGPIYSTGPTKELAEVMYEDGVGIMEEEARRHDTTPLYGREEVKKTLGQWKTVAFHEPTPLAGGYTAVFKIAGHILGSAIVSFERGGRVLAFTGDLGNSPSPILKDTESISGTHTLVMESVYGDRNHETRDERLEKLEDIIEETIKARGALIIPAFSIERTQVLLYEMNKLVEYGRIPQVPVYLDSPLAIKVTEIYKHNKEFFNKQTTDMIEGGDDVFDFPGLTFTRSSEESKKINSASNPKIIIAGSGMSDGGRVTHHQIRYLPYEENTLLIVGYQAPGTLGRRLVDGAKSVNIFGKDIPVRARVANLRGYSSHKDSTELFEFVRGATDTLEKVYLAMGEPKSSMFLAQRIRDYLGVPTFVPEEGEQTEINL